MALSHQKQLRYAVCLHIDKEHNDKESRYNIAFAENEHMLRKNEWPAHVPAGYIQKSVIDPQTGAVVLNKIHRLHRKKLTKDPMLVPCRMCGESIHLLRI